MCNVLCSVGTQVKFQLSDYAVVENAGEVQVCVELQGNNLGNESGTVSVTTQDGSAIGEFTQMNLSYSLLYCRTLSNRP